MNPDLLPPTSTKTEFKTDKQSPTKQAGNTAENKTTNSNVKTNQTKNRFILPKNLPKSVYLLFALLVTAIILITLALLIPKKNSIEKSTIQTDNIPEPDISISFSKETKQTPFADEITTFKENSSELDYNYPTYNLPIIETEVNLSK